MNIYEARKLQQALYKQSNTFYKCMRTTIEDGELYYEVINAISDCNVRTLDKELIAVLTPSVNHDDVKVYMFYHGGDWMDWPDGIYLAEIIKID